MPIITTQEINAIAFTEPIDLAFINDDIVYAAEGKFLISVITRPLFDDLSVHPDNYTTLIADYIKPFLAYCIKYIVYSQYFNKMNLTALTNQQRDSILIETNVILEEKKRIIINHLSSGIYPLFKSQSKKLITGFLIHQSKNL